MAILGRLSCYMLFTSYSRHIFRNLICLLPSTGTSALLGLNACGSKSK
jgi:hypothetical protein